MIKRMFFVPLFCIFEISKKPFGLAKATPRCALGCLCSWWTLASWERRSSMSWATLIWDFIWNRFARAQMIPNGLEGASANISCHRVCMLHASWHSVTHDLLWMTTNFTIVSDGADVQPKQWQSWSVLLRPAGKQLHWPPGQVSFFLDMRCEVHVSMTFSQISRLREPRDAYKDQTRPNPADRKSWWTWGRCCAFGRSKLIGMETLNHGTKWIFEHFILRATQRVASTCSSHLERSRWTPEKVDGHGWQLLLFPFLIAFCRCLALKWLGIDVIGW